MTIAVIEATGFVENNITQELVNRHIEVIGISGKQKAWAFFSPSIIRCALAGY